MYRAFTVQCKLVSYIVLPGWHRDAGRGRRIARHPASRMATGGGLDTWTSWRFLAWLQAWPLNRSTLLDYFKQSCFYDPSCNNE